jgi:excinuclease UvrABC ATPase subunit
MEIRIKVDEKLLKQTLESKLNNGKKVHKETFDKLFVRMEWNHRDILEKVSKELELQTIEQIVNSFSFLKYKMEKFEMINKHNKRLKLKNDEFKSGYWTDTESNCCPKCNGSGSQLSLNQDGIEHSESYLKEKYKKDFGPTYY